MIDEQGEIPPRAETLFTVTATRVATAVVLTVTGEIDMLTAPQLRATAAEAITGPDVGALILDLSQVEFLGSPGLAMLVELDAVAGGRGAVLRIVVDHNRSVAEPVRITGLDKHLVVFHSLPDALAADADAAGETLRDQQRPRPSCPTRGGW